MERGKIYSFVGPAGGGKSYAADEIIGKSHYDGVPYISADFSDGIRSVILTTFTGNRDADIDVNSEDYAEWKKGQQVIYLPLSQRQYIYDGRTIMKNLGEYLKEMIGNEIWANWTLNKVMRTYYNMDLVSRGACNIVFGSLRFDVELQAILKCAELTKKEVEIRFCNYHNKKKSACQVEPHPSERLAQSLIKYDFKHGDIITEYLV